MATNRKKKNFKRNFRDKDFQSDKIRDKEYVPEETNDASWYSKYAELTRDTASIPYSIPTGTRLSWDVLEDPTKPMFTDSGTATNPVVCHQSIPGIMTMGIAPAVGVSIDATSPLNVASKFLYTKVRAENSGAKNYDAPDLMLYCLAMDQVYSLITWYNRIYAIMMLYSQVNRYLPKALLDAQWVDFDDMILHINDFKSFIDTATAQAAAFSVPDDISLFRRHAFMYQNIYKDAESPKAQLYQYVPTIFYYYDEMNGPGKLVPIHVPTHLPNNAKYQFYDLVVLFHELMDPIIASQDFNTMSGDILKAFGSDHLIKLAIMPSGYAIVPITDYEVLTQFKNATITQRMNVIGTYINYGTDNFCIKQDPNVEYLVFDPILGHNATDPFYWKVGDRLLSTYKTDPTPEDNLVYTRLMYVCTNILNAGDNSYNLKFNSVGSEYPTTLHVTYFYQDTNLGWTFGTVNLNTVSEARYGFGNAAMIRAWYYSKHFDFCPALYIFADYTNNQTAFYPLFDVDNYTIVHAYELEKMHRTAVMSLLRVPLIGSPLEVTKRSVRSKK